MRPGSGLGRTTSPPSGRASCAAAPSASRTRPTSNRVAVVNETLARKFSNTRTRWANISASSDPDHTADYEIVGVVEDAKYQDTHGPAYATVFLPYLQRVTYTDPPIRRGQIRSHKIDAIELHVAGTPENLESTVRRTLAEVDPDMTVLRMTAFDEQVSENFNQERLLAQDYDLVWSSRARPGRHRFIWGDGLYGRAAYPRDRRSAWPSAPIAGTSWPWYCVEPSGKSPWGWRLVFRWRFLPASSLRASSSK